MKQTQHFFIDQSLAGERVLLEDRDLLRQMREVLRFRKGDACVLLDNQGNRAKARLEEFHSKGASFAIEERSFVPPPERRVWLYCALSKKPATFEWILEKATELGVTDLVPLDTERTQVHELRKLERMEAILKEAAEQCERAYRPILHPLKKLATLVKEPPQGALLAGDAWTYEGPLSQMLPPKNTDLHLVIGPEGGLSESELAALKAAGFKIFVLGNTVLRMETAVIAALALLQYV